MAEPASTPPHPGPPRRPSGLHPRWIILLFLLGLFLALSFIRLPGTEAPVIRYSDFYRDVADKKVKSVVLDDHSVTGTFASPQTIAGRSTTSFQTTLPEIEDPGLLALMRDRGVDVGAHEAGPPILPSILLSVLPWALILGAWLWMSRRAGQALSARGPLGMLARGRVRRFNRESDVTVRFADVAGLAAAKCDLQEIVDFLRDPARFRKLGGHIPRGVLLVGPPGTGKTLLARAVAGEAQAPFFYVDGSEFIELFVGVGAARVRELFEEAKRASPAMVFIDEIDAVGRTRGTGLGGGSDEREQTLNQLLSAMDGFGHNDTVIVLGATNRPDVLDPALLRPGRFDRRVVVDLPELGARIAILQVHARGKPLAADVDLSRVGAMTPGFSGADLENLVNEAALAATRRRADAIGSSDFVAAYDKVVLGDPRETVLSESERTRVAVHEAGHTVVAHFTPGADRLDRVSILPRGMALGTTHQVPAGDRHLVTRTAIEAHLCVWMGGLSAETLVFGDASSGAEHDLRRATALAVDMVAHYGMSESVGPVYHRHAQEHPFLGQTMAVGGGTSDATVHLIELEVQATLAEATQAATRTIRTHRPVFDRLVAALLESETLEGERLERILSEPGAASAA